VRGHRHAFTNALIVFPAGSRFDAQPYAMRAPEVFLGQACTEPSQVWAVAAMLLCWIKPGVLGVWDSPHSLIDKAWSMAKIKRLFPNWNIPTPDEVEGDSFKAAVKSARRLSQEDTGLQVILPLEEEMQGVEIPQQLRELLRLILVVDLSERPSALSVLASKEFRAFETFISV
jgi:serine/threonine protein kinase